MINSIVKNADTAVMPEDSGQQQANNNFQHTEIKGRFNQYTSGYWALTLPALAARYVGRYATQLLGLGEKSPRLYSGLAGGWMLGITSLYASRTYRDMKRVFSETLAYEFDKKPEDVGIRDFFKSQNAIVHRTLWNFLKYNTRRYAVSSTFFASFLPWKRVPVIKDIVKTPLADSVDLGVGVTGGYLFLDVLNRKVTFFEALQNFIDTKINHTESIGQPVTDTDLLNLYAIHARDNDPKNPMSGRMDTLAWKEEQIIFGRMADLMNQTYGNAIKSEQANFTVPKLVYLLGNGLIKKENIEQSLMYIEIANRYGMDAVKQAAVAIKAGAKPADILDQFPVTLPTQAAAKEEDINMISDKHVLRLNEQKQKEMLQSESRVV